MLDIDYSFFSVIHFIRVFCSCIRYASLSGETTEAVTSRFFGIFFFFFQLCEYTIFTLLVLIIIKTIIKTAFLAPNKA